MNTREPALLNQICRDILCSFLVSRLGRSVKNLKELDICFGYIMRHVM